MQKDPLIRKQVLEGFFEDMYPLSDEKYQIRVWVKGEGWECCTIESTIGDVFDSGRDILEVYTYFGITESQHELLIELFDKIDKFDEKYRTAVMIANGEVAEQLIALPEWQEIRERSKNILQSFHFKNEPFPLPRGIFPRPKGIPENYGARLTPVTAGRRFVPPDDEEIYVRVMHGKPYSQFPCLHKAYVVQQKHGNILDKHGHIVSRKTPEAHIPFDEFVFRRVSVKQGEEQKKYILNEHLKSIFAIANKEYQEKVWIHGEGLEVDDFDETCCHFFNDGNPILKNYRDFGITEPQYKLLKHLRDEFASFVCDKSPYLPEEFIETLTWEKIMNLAKEVLEAFGYTKN